MTKRRLSAYLTVLLVGLAACGSSAPKPATMPPSEESQEPVESGLATESAEPAPSDEEEEDALQRDYGKFVRYELVSAKPAAMAALYSKLLGWSVTSVPGADDTFTIANQGREVGHLSKFDPASPIPAGWMCWISVEDIDDMMRDVPANGGEVLAAPSATEDGRVAVVKGPTGGVFGVIELHGSAPQDSSPQPGDFVLSQLWTDDFEDARSFYSVVGDYTSDDVTFGTTKYSIMRGNGIPRAMIRLAPKGKASRWMPFVLSAEPEAMARSAAALGATIVTQARDIPTLGRVAVVEMPGGGIIGFITPE